MVALINKEHMTTVCKIGQGADCCRYVLGGHMGIECGKHSSLKKTIDERVAAGLFTAQADNCEGLVSSEEKLH